MRVTGMSERAYRAARRRLAQALERLLHTAAGSQPRPAPRVGTAQLAASRMVGQIEHAEPFATPCESATSYRAAA